MWIPISIWYDLPSAWRTPFNISHSVGLLVTSFSRTWSSGLLHSEAQHHSFLRLTLSKNLKWTNISCQSEVGAWRAGYKHYRTTKFQSYKFLFTINSVGDPSSWCLGSGNDACWESTVPGTVLSMTHTLSACEGDEMSPAPGTYHPSAKGSR